MFLNQFIENAERQVQQAAVRCKTEHRILIARYTAAIKSNFQMWLGFITPRHPYAQWAVKDNLQLEKQEDHVGMLHDFALSSQALPHRKDYAHTDDEVRAVNKLFTNVKNCGLSGLALAAVLENTSKIFIPDLAKRAKECGCTDFTYTDKHGEADVAHSDAFLKAVELEMTMGYANFRNIIHKGVKAGATLIVKIYS